MVSFKVYDPKVKGSSQGVIDVNTAIGFSLILANLAFDGFTSATQVSQPPLVTAPHHTHAWLCVGLQDRVFRDARDRAATKALKDGKEEEEQDPTLDVSSFDMMYRVNLWSTFLLFGWVAVSYVVFGPASELVLLLICLPVAVPSSSRSHVHDRCCTHTHTESTAAVSAASASSWATDGGVWHTGCHGPGVHFLHLEQLWRPYAHHGVHYKVKFVTGL